MGTLVTEYFSAYTSEKLEAGDVYLPLSDAARADLLKLLDTEDKYIYFSLKDETNFETVRATAAGGLILLDRAVEGTAPVLHPMGTCVTSVSPTIVATIKDLICTYECCDTGCPVEPVAYDSVYLPAAYVGQAWSGIIRFTGSTPMMLSIANPPAWMTVIQNKKELQLSGTPTETGTFSLGAFGFNGNGTNTATKEVLLTVAE